MTPAARISAAADILDQVLGGAPAERSLTNWARANRFAGSGDRAAVRDHVFDVLRRLNSCARLGGGRSGRALLLGWVVAQGLDPDTLFDGSRFAPDPIQPEERAAMERGSAQPAPEGEDVPDWLRPVLLAELGAEFAPVAAALSQRAPVFLRVNTLRGDREAALAALAADGFEAEPVADVATALRIRGTARGLAAARAVTQGVVELQDLSPQRAVLALPDPHGQTVLDLCAGGGGKALALAARGAKVTAHDISAARLDPLAARAQRAGAQIAQLPPGEVSGRYDLVLADVPCSGSGTWRRSAEARWRLTSARLAELTAIQDQLLDQAARHTRAGGQISYMTCSILRQENHDRIADFLTRHPGFTVRMSALTLPELEGGDGFFHALLQAPSEC